MILLVTLYHGKVTKESDWNLRGSANGPGDRGSILGWIIRKTQKMLLDISSLNSIIRYVSGGSGSIKGKEYRPPLHFGVVAIKKGAFASPPTTVGKFMFSIISSNYMHIYQDSTRAGYDTRSIFKRSLTGLNSEFSFFETSCLTRAVEPSLSYYLAIAGGRIIGFIPFPKVLVLCKIQLAWSRIWTRVVVSISYDDNHYTTSTFKQLYGFTKLI